MFYELQLTVAFNNNLKPVFEETEIKPTVIWLNEKFISESLEVELKVEWYKMLIKPLLSEIFLNQLPRRLVGDPTHPPKGDRLIQVPLD